MIQALIFIFSCLSITLFARKRTFRWGFIVGLCGQPFWVYETLRLEQWGMFAISLYFAFTYLIGVRNHWKPCGTTLN